MLIVADVRKDLQRAAATEAFFDTDKLNIPRSEIPNVTSD
jgi:hypothetical protein